MPLTVADRSILEQAARDNGFDGPPQAESDWIRVGSSRVKLVLALGGAGDRWLVGPSLAHVATALGEMGMPTPTVAPGAARTLEVRGIPALFALVRRAFQLARALPTAPLDEFKERTHGLPRSTEVERLAVQRVGQDIYRCSLLDYWQARCAVTGLDVPELLRASHAKPWSHCVTDAERLDVYNGFLLAPHLDALFDAGFITFDDDGQILVSAMLPATARARLGIDTPQRLARIEDEHHHYLQWHRTNEFRGGAIVLGG